MFKVLFLREEAIVFGPPLILVMPTSGLHINLRPSWEWINTIIYASGNIGVIFLSFFLSVSNQNWIQDCTLISWHLHRPLTSSGLEFAAHDKCILIDADSKILQKGCWGPWQRICGDTSRCWPLPTWWPAWTCSRANSSFPWKVQSLMMFKPLCPLFKFVNGSSFCFKTDMIWDQIVSYFLTVVQALTHAFFLCGGR